MATNAEEKRRIRDEMRALRRAIGPVTQREHAWRLRGAIRFRNWFRRSRRLGCYWATDGEISLEPLIALSWRLGKGVYLPVIEDCGKMQFRECRPGDALRKNRIGILEPPSSAATIRADELDVVFVPLVAFSAEGNRLGMGGGYYDRLFAPRGSHRWQSRDVKPHRGVTRLVGVAHECQRRATLPIDEWDVPMHMIVTESGIVWSV